MIRLWIALAAVFALIAPLPAVADAHPGFHLNPHLDEHVILVAVIGLVLLSIAIMWMHVAILRRHNRRVAERLIRERLNL